MNNQKIKKEGNINKLKSRFISNHSRISAIIIYNIVTLIVTFIFFPLIPKVLNYAPFFDEYNKNVSLSYLNQFLILQLLFFVVGTLIYGWIFRDINKWKDILNDRNANYSEISKIRKKCIKMPYSIFIGQLAIINGPVIPTVLIITAINGVSYAMAFKILIMVFSLSSLAAVFSLIFTKSIFTKILIETFDENLHEGRRINLRQKIFMQIIPMFIVAILFTSLVGFSRVIEEKGNLMYKVYKTQLDENFRNIGEISNVEQIKERLEGIGIYDVKTTYFIIAPDKKITTSDGTMPGKYLLGYLDIVGGDRTYDGSAEVQAIVKRLNGPNGEWVAGIKFEVASNETVLIILFALVALLAINVLVLFYFSKSISGDISMVARGLTEIAQGEAVDLDKKLAVTSNDEIADLVIAFNKIQEREKEHIKEIEEKQAIMMEQERLASLGSLIGGIAHNMRTPIMAISGGIEGLKDLIREYDDSIDDKNVTTEDHHLIAKDMLEWIDKMRPYCSYMSDILTAVKDQTVQYKQASGLSFSIGEMESRIKILMEHELRKRNCRLNVNLDVDSNLYVKGDISIIIQVINNLIINAAQSYDGKGGEIEFIVAKNNNNLVFTIKDFGRGIPLEVKDRLFKEMVTTKGTKGTGLGLYMSYSNVKARFGGKLWFESELGKGTTFYVSIPV